MIKFMNIWLVGNIKENIAPLQYLTKPHVEHIKNGPNHLSKMRQVIKQLKYFGLEEIVWGPGSWNGEVITNMWSTIWHRLNPYLHTKVNINK